MPDALLATSSAQYSLEGASPSSLMTISLSIVLPEPSGWDAVSIGVPLAPLLVHHESLARA
jgi:hypothetical protein